MAILEILKYPEPTLQKTSARVARDIVSETSERLVRDEIERIKSKARS